MTTIKVDRPESDLELFLKAAEKHGPKKVHVVKELIRLGATVDLAPDGWITSDAPEGYCWCHNGHHRASSMLSDDYFLERIRLGIKPCTDEHCSWNGFVSERDRRGLAKDRLRWLKEGTLAYPPDSERERRPKIWCSDHPMNIAARKLEELDHQNGDDDEIFELHKKQYVIQSVGDPGNIHLRDSEAAMLMGLTMTAYQRLQSERKAPIARLSAVCKWVEENVDTQTQPDLVETNVSESKQSKRKSSRRRTA